MKKTDIEKVKIYLKEEGYKINDEFIEGWFDFFNKKGTTVEQIAEKIIGEYDFATDMPNI